MLLELVTDITTKLNKKLIKILHQAGDRIIFTVCAINATNDSENISVIKILLKIDGNQVLYNNEREYKFAKMYILVRNPPQLVTVRNTCEYETYFIIEYDYYSEGDLFDYCESNWPISDEVRATFTKSLLTGLLQLHWQKLAHLDIKPENLLVKKGLVYLTDFGNIMPTRCKKIQGGTSDYLAPELSTKYLSEVDDPTKCDIYSAGLILLNIRYGDSDQEIINMIKPESPVPMVPIVPVNQALEKYQVDPSDHLYNDLISHMIDHNPKTRYSAKQCLRHPFCKNIKESYF
jgi:serine/threonine protein kinase